MFGYVRPVREELKCKDFDLYRATYCGLCRELRRKYGLLAPMFLNFDFTFLALLLWPAEQRFVPCRGRCHANPLARKEMCPADPALEAAAEREPGPGAAKRRPPAPGYMYPPGGYIGYTCASPPVSPIDVSAVRTTRASRASCTA